MQERVNVGRITKRRILQPQVMGISRIIRQPADDPVGGGDSKEKALPNAGGGWLRALFFIPLLKASFQRS